VLGAVIVIAKQPVAGRVKTRLAPALTYAQAAEVAGAALVDTLRVAAAVPAERHVLAFDGDAGGWLPPGWSLTPQPDGDLDRRLVSAFAAAGDGPALLVGMDTPQITIAQILAFDPDRFDACLGFAADGGYWAIGFREPDRHADLIEGVPMSTSYTGAAQLSALKSRGLRVQLLDELVDVDTIAEARLVSAQHPDLQFSTALRSVTAKQVA
jgi:glycosyltransferase A (GT-A) superfamily protein (DUF2064 family)